MRVIAILILIFGVVLAGGAVFFASERYAKIEAALARQAEEARASRKPEIRTKPVVVAARALRYGETLTADALRVAAFPEDAVPETGFATLEEVLGTGAEEPRIVLRAMEQSEPILRSRITGFGERATMSAQLSPGMRAFTLRIDSVSGVAGFLLPNDRVDVFLTRNDGDGLMADLIMQNVKVIAVDQVAEEISRARLARTATVEVTPEQAQKLALAQQIGKISLTLRQIEETGVSPDPKPIGVDDVVTREPEPPAPPPAPRAPCVRKGVELICE